MDYSPIAPPCASRSNFTREYEEPEMSMRFLTGLAGLIAVAGLVMGQAKVSKKEADAYNAILSATTPDAQIEAADKFVTSFADSQLKSTVLYLAAHAAETKGDVTKALVYAQSAIDADPKNYQAMILVAGELARGTRENDLDKEEKLARAEKLATDAIATVKSAPKPNAQLTDDQWNQYKQDFAAQAHEDLAMSAAVRKKYDVAIAEFKLALDGPMPPASTFVRLATVYDQSNKPDDSLAVLNKVLAMPNLDPAVKRYADREKAVAEKLKAGK
jgi:tetratricopeptide (TPR) repeat protein